MARQINLHQLKDLANEETPNEILINTKPKTEIHILAANDRTVIKLPFGNRFDIIDGLIIIY